MDLIEEEEIKVVNEIWERESLSEGLIIHIYWMVRPWGVYQLLGGLRGHGGHSFEQEIFPFLLISGRVFVFDDNGIL